MEITSGVTRLGNGTINSYLVAAEGGVTIVDAGVPGYWNDLVAELSLLGRSLADVRAVLLTHGHSDHIGYAERIRREQRVPIFVSEPDAALARGEVPNPSKGFGPIRPMPLIRFLIYSARRGALRQPTIDVVSTFGDGATLDVPGSPRVILLPGHTPGSAALHLSSEPVVFVGDAFATYAVTTGRRGPQIAPFTADEAQALSSLERLRSIGDALALPGHGEPWSGSMAEVLELVAATRTSPAA